MSFMIREVIFIYNYPVNFQSGSGLLETFVDDLINNRNFLV